MSSSLIFYTHPRSRGRIIRWLLEELEVPYETKVIPYGPEMKSEEYLSINRMGKVPTIDHNGEVVTECGAICAYLADQFPEKKLAPPLQKRGAYYRWLFFAAGPIDGATTAKSLGITLSEEQLGSAGYGSLESVVAALVDRLEGSPYVAGEEFSAADILVGS